MARETKSVQVYPDDYTVNQRCKQEEIFGWEVLGNQSVQQFKGSDPDGTEHYESYIKLTFSRDKAAPWYAEVAALEKEYHDLEYNYNSALDKKPKEYNSRITYLIALVGGFSGLGLLEFWNLGLYILIPTAAYVGYRIYKASTYKKNLAEWEESNKSISEIPVRKRAIEERCNELING